MNIERKTTYPTQADVDQIIAQARIMRAEYIAKLVKAGLAKAAGLFSRSHKPSIAR